jgi:uncharacterized membrane protein (UPF0127 family)
MPTRLRRLPCLVLRSGSVLAVAAGWRARLCGLAGLRAPPRDVALLLAPCRSVHTVGMRWPLDLVWLGAGGAVLQVDCGVQPWRIRSCRRACAVVETPAGGGASMADALRRYPSAIAAAPATTAAAPASRAPDTCSRPHSAAAAVAMTTLVSRSAATGAASARSSASSVNR